MGEAMAAMSDMKINGMVALELNLPTTFECDMNIVESCIPHYDSARKLYVPLWFPNGHWILFFVDVVKGILIHYDPKRVIGYADYHREFFLMSPNWLLSKTDKIPPNLRNICQLKSSKLNDSWPKLDEVHFANCVIFVIAAAFAAACGKKRKLRRIGLLNRF